MRRVLISLLLLSLLQGAVAYAMLGQAPSALFQQRQQTAPGAARYAIHVSSEDGGTLRRYANSDGAVFAVRWDGPYLPDLAVVLDAHHAGKEPAPMVVISGAKAWIPAALPDGFSTDSDW